jgi:hypothetical protein
MNGENIMNGEATVGVETNGETAAATGGRVDYAIAFCRARPEILDLAFFFSGGG